MKYFSDIFSSMLKVLVDNIFITSHSVYNNTSSIMNTIRLDVNATV